MGSMSAQGTLPVAGGSLVAAPVTDTINHIMSTYNGKNITVENCDTTGSDGIVDISSDQSVTGAKTLTGALVANGGVVLNEGAADVDFRVEGDTNANLINLDGGQDALSFGGANVDGAAATFNNLTKRTAVTSVGQQVHVPAQTTNFDNASSTIAIGAATFIGIPTMTGDNATLTMTNAATLYVQGAPVAGSNVTHTTAGYSLWVDAGATQLDGTVGVGGTLSVSADIDMVANGNRIDLDADNDTSIRASADDTISIEVAGADDFTITANSLNVLTGSVIDLADNAPVQFGDADDASIKWDASNLAVSAGTAAVNITAGDLTLYDDNNNADVSLTMGTGSAESLSIQVLNGSSNKTAEEVKFVTATASSTANHGKMTFNVDGTDVLSIDDDGIAMGAARTIETTSGAMTLTSAAAATWSTSAGALTINGNAGVNIQEDGTDVIAIDTSRAVALTLGSDATGDIFYRNASGKLARLAVGSDGEVLKLASGLPSWAADTAGVVDSIANGADNRIVTFSDSDSLNGEANLTFNGSALQVTGTLTVGVDDTGHDVKFFGASTGKYILWDEAQDTLQFVDNTNLTFGTGNDADIFYDGTDLNISPAVVGAGDIVVNGASMEFDDSEGVTFGTGKDATIQYDGTNLNVNPDAVGSGRMAVLGNASAGILGTDGTFHVHTATAGSVAAHANGDDLVVENDAAGGISILTPNNVPGVILFGDADDNNTGGITYDHSNTRMSFEVEGGESKIILDNSGSAYLGGGETANGKMTIGMTVNQAANDDEAFAIKSSDVAHGRTGHAETDTWYSLRKYDGNKGGCLQYVMMDNEAQCPNFDLRVTGGQATTAATQDNCHGLMTIRVAQHDGSNSPTAMTAGGFPFAVRCTDNSNNDHAVFAVDEDGDLYAGNTNDSIALSDDKNDPALLRGFDHAIDEMGLASGMIKNRWDDFVKTRDQDLVDLGILGDTVANGGLYCVTQHTRLMNSAIWQVYSMLLDVIDSLPTETQNKIRQVVPNQLLLEVA